METLIPQIAELLNNTLSPDHTIVGSATEALDRLSLLPDFPSSLISIATGGEDQGQRISAATYLKNFIRRNVDADDSASKVTAEFRNRLVHASLLAEPAVLKVLVEAFRAIVVKEFVKENTWPELVPELRSVIQNSNYISESPDSQWKTINALTILQSILRPFQYFLNPSLKKEPVPPQLELIGKEILVPLLAVFHNFVEKALSVKGRTEIDLEKILLLVCKCIYFSVRSHMPSALSAALPSFCQDLFRILNSLGFSTTTEDDYLIRVKTGKRSLLIFRALVTRHRKHSDKLMPNIVNCATKIVKQGIDISKLDFPSERVVSLAFDVISHVLETGPGWRLVSPHFSSLMDSAIFPALVMNEKDISEWEEDPDEYLRRNLPSDLEEISGWREDLFTARKSAINLLGVISMSKGPPMSSNSSSASVKRKKSERIKARELRNSMGELLVLPFLSKFRVPCGATVVDAKVSKEYYGVLMAYGGLQDFLRERNREYTATLIRTRVLPLYSLSTCSPYLVAAANWVLGELASCLPEDMSENIYSSLLKALVMPDEGDVSCYPVRASAAGAIVELLENDYLPPEWLPLLQVVISRTDNEDDNESSILFQLLSTIVETGSDNVTVHIPYIVSTMVGVISKHIPPIPEPWPQVVERGFSAVAVMAQTLEDSMPEETEENEDSEKLMAGWGTCVRAFSVLLTQAWLTPGQTMEEDVTNQLPPTSCINDASIMLRSIMRFVTEAKEVLEMKVLELLTVWADLIADWHAWEELEDLSIFDCIKEVVYLCRKCEFKDIFMRRMLSPVPHRSIIENIAAFLSEAITQYPSATWRACSCVHLLLHIPDFSSEIKEVQQSLVATFTQAAFSRFREVESKPNAIWKPLLLVISSCYLFYPDIVEKVLKKDGNKGFMDWASGLSYISTSSFEPGLSAESEIKLIVMALVKVVERLLGPSGDPSCGLVRDCFISLMEAVIRLKEVKEEDENEDEEADEEEDDDEDEDEESDDDEDSEDDEREETEEEFLDRYAKASISLENGLDVEEGDIEDQDQELELGVLGKVDQEIVALSLIERYNHIFTNGQTLPPQVITGFLNTFPEHASLFSHA